MDKSLYQIHKHRKSEEFKRVKKILRISNKIISEAAAHSSQKENDERK